MHFAYMLDTCNSLNAHVACHSSDIHDACHSLNAHVAYLQVRTVLPTRWQTKVFAVTCVRKVIALCTPDAVDPATNPHLHLDVARRELAAKGDFLVAHLGELVRAFVPAFVPSICTPSDVSVCTSGDVSVFTPSDVSVF